ncbi:hypothetical protein L3X38_020769 [Prunus dulcis]|uniref:Uncharacterized protein n=1 Tax=Prunus dulcis TaxID=3755 RepID=A0AAD4WDE2_PRUDU|nr:hypothetical protein L3X38_020769 [Prunus dulcis]
MRNNCLNWGVEGDGEFTRLCNTEGDGDGRKVLATPIADSSLYWWFGHHVRKEHYLYSVVVISGLVTMAAQLLGFSFFFPDIAADDPRPSEEEQ